jgi:acyl carrier protein
MEGRKAEMKKLMALLSELRPDIDFETARRLMDDGLLDSLDLVVIVGEIEEQFAASVNVNDITPENCHSAEAIVARIQKRGGSI